MALLLLCSIFTFFVVCFVRCSHNIMSHLNWFSFAALFFSLVLDHVMPVMAMQWGKKLSRSFKKINNFFASVSTVVSLALMLH